MASALHLANAVKPLEAPLPSYSGVVLSSGPAAAQPQGQPAPADAHESAVQMDPTFSLDKQVARRAEWGLAGSQSKAFIDGCEFVSLGNFCGVANALQSLGLRRSANPFDWVRSPMDGVIHCFENDFEDFLTFANVKQTENGHPAFTQASWGGSFWHHDPLADGTKEDFTRRIQRMLGLGDVPASKPRVFIRAVNSTRELNRVPRLHKTLQAAFPNAQVYILLIIDLQDEKGPVHLAGDSGNILFYRCHRDIFTHSDAEPWSMEKCRASYCEAISFAINYWADRESVQSEITIVQDLARLGSACDQFDGGDPSAELFWPRRFQGHRIELRRSSRSEAASSAKDSEAKADSSARESKASASLVSQGQISDLVIPEGVKPGSILETTAFGRQIRVQIPADASPGQLLRLRFAEQGAAITCAIVAAAAAATMATSTTATSAAAMAATSKSAVPMSPQVHRQQNYRVPRGPAYAPQHHHPWLNHKSTRSM